jgi:cytochrome c
MRPLTRIGWVAACALAPSLLLARVHPFGDAGLYARGGSTDAIRQQRTIPDDVRAVLTAKCADCHSEQTRTPPYGRFAPVSWLLERDIIEARKQMDLSHWDIYAPEQQETLKAKILQQARSGSMPLVQYRMVHWSTRITPADIAALTKWARAAPMADAAGIPLVPGDPANGRAVFLKRCTGCHALDRNIEGPRLQGIYGRPTAAIPGFPYSAALNNVHGTWNEQSLDRWLQDPDSFASGSNMDFRVPKAQERRDLISFFANSVR